MSPLQGKEIQTTHRGIPDPNLPFQPSLWSQTCPSACARYTGHSSNVPPTSLPCARHTPSHSPSLAFSIKPFPHLLGVGVLSLLWTPHYCSHLFKYASYWPSPGDLEERWPFMGNELRGRRKTDKHLNAVINAILSAIHKKSQNREASLGSAGYKLPKGRNWSPLSFIPPSTLSQVLNVE